MSGFARVVERWVETEIRADNVAKLRFIGAERGGRWADVTAGSNRVGDLQVASVRENFAWRPESALITVRDPESGEQVLLDGNERACKLQLAVTSGAISPDEPVRLITGDLHPLVVLISRATSSLWR